MKKFLSLMACSVALSSSLFAMIPTEIVVNTNDQGNITFKTVVEHQDQLVVGEIVKEYDLLTEKLKEIYAEEEREFQTKISGHQTKIDNFKQAFDNLKNKMTEMGAEFDVYGNITSFPIIDNESKQKIVQAYFNTQKNLNDNLTTQELLIKYKQALYGRDFSVLYYASDVISFIEKLLDPKLTILNPDQLMHCSDQCLKDTYTGNRYGPSAYRLCDIDREKLSRFENWRLYDFDSYKVHVLRYFFTSKEDIKKANFYQKTLKRPDSSFYEDRGDLQKELETLLLKTFARKLPTQGLNLNPDYTLDHFDKDLEMLNTALHNFDSVKRLCELRLSQYELALYEAPHDNPIEETSSLNQDLLTITSGIETETTKLSILQKLEDAFETLKTFISRDLNIS